jgi:hypothetical protein
VLALGLAIGANGAIFSLVDGLWFRPPGIRSPGAIVRVFSTTTTNQSGLWSFPEYTALRDQTSSFAGVVARGGRGALLVGKDGASELLLVNVVSMNFFTALGVTPAYGRLFAPGDELLLARAPGVVLGHAFWRRHFGGDPGIVGQSIPLSGKSVTVGRASGDFPRDRSRRGSRSLDTAGDLTLLSNANEFTSRDSRWFVVLHVASPPCRRVRQHRSVHTRRLTRATFRRAIARRSRDLRPRLPYGAGRRECWRSSRSCCWSSSRVNVANLPLARPRPHARTRVRVALGAGRRRLVRQLMLESMLLGAAGAAAGLIVAMWLIRSCRHCSLLRLDSSRRCCSPPICASCCSRWRSRS